MDPEWFARLENEMKKDYFKKLKSFLKAEQAAQKKIYPPEHLIHSWSREAPLHKVKVVVLGQDPYHGPGQACGHSFSVPKGVAVPGSLKNIYKELASEYPGAFAPPKHGDLTGWAKQGVLLLNACLTVSAGQAGSHHGKGWEPFTRSVLKLVAQEAAKGGSSVGGSSSTCKGVVFLVWGQPAARSLIEAGINDKSPNILILRSPHPSPLSAHRGFLGNGHFKKANEWLEKRYGPGGGIDWAQLP
ncbi:uracil-DNA glycosylase [Tilletiaria anomala UBC 951]|uniref:Uracil-DNA glycosylase n=1 Tax=Tilletiaria anomala (strain ATCC 24038 / CBS 436.72 / UBC 951) TaxID=1037660 RepID=A0A066WRS5_TILAU|nr:uracil-DNA glycosylase [Tilletiaria anomala UBC 951]KDN53335.1 uracil-DNA glycosylase [Tilletiaria anomala UBC 951]